MDSHSPSRAREEIAATIEHYTGEKPRTDTLTQRIRQDAERLNLPTPGVQRWIRDFCEKRKADGYTVSPGLIGKAFGEDAIPWMKKNARAIEETRRHARAKADREAPPPEVTQMPQAPEPAAEADPQFGRKLIGEIRRGQKARGA